jgi:hypothetical protein
MRLREHAARSFSGFVLTRGAKRYSRDSTLEPDSTQSQATGETVPCIHALFYRPAPTLRLEPVETSEWEASRQRLLQYIARGTEDDLLAAEWVLLHLLARVYAAVRFCFGSYFC